MTEWDEVVLAFGLGKLSVKAQIFSEAGECFPVASLPLPTNPVAAVDWDGGQHEKSAHCGSMLREMRLSSGHERANGAEDLGANFL